MAKPIFCIGVPFITFNEQATKDLNKLKKEFSDYHFLVYTHNNKELIFQVFYDKDITEKKIGKVQKFIKSEMNKIVKNVDSVKKHEQLTEPNCTDCIFFKSFKDGQKKRCINSHSPYYYNEGANCNTICTLFKHNSYKL